ncbi:MAG: hypothetical protein ACP5PT_05010 [Brevinematia bacterium]
MIIITTNNTLIHIVRRFFPEEEIKVVLPSSIKNLVMKNEIVLTDEAEFTKLIPRSAKHKTIITFIENLSKDRNINKILKSADPLKESHKLRDFVEIISLLKKVLTSEVEISNLNLLPQGKSIKEEFILEGNIKNTPEEAIDKIITFIEKHNLLETIDRDNVIISSCEIIDNIIEVYISLNQVNIKTKLELYYNEKYFSISISDYLGLADIYSISKSMIANSVIDKEDLFKRNIDEIIDSITIRGRGYTLMKKTSDRVITTILREENKLKYNSNWGFTKTSITYYLVKKGKEKALNIAIEFC